VHPGVRLGVPVAMIRIGIILGSTRPNRNGEQVATWVYDMASRRSDADFELTSIQHHIDDRLASARLPMAT
jgi:NAD(P)H-dependent FMN reductase